MDCKASAVDCRTNCVSPFGGCSAGCLVGCSASDEITFGVGRKFAWPNPAGKGNAFASEFIPHDGLIGDASLEGERTSGGREGDEAHHPKHPIQGDEAPLPSARAGEFCSDLAGVLTKMRFNPSYKIPSEIDTKIQNLWK